IAAHRALHRWRAPAIRVAVAAPSKTPDAARPRPRCVTSPAPSEHSEDAPRAYTELRLSSASTSSTTVSDEAEAPPSAANIAERRSSRLSCTSILSFAPTPAMLQFRLANRASRAVADAVLGSRTTVTVAKARLMAAESEWLPLLQHYAVFLSGSGGGGGGGAVTAATWTPGSSALVSAVDAGRASLFVAFGGQGNVEDLFDELVTVHAAYERMAAQFLQQAAATLAAHWTSPEALKLI
ncbi:hypothetical protein HK405_011521, partial [Cladochytrium tenue]